MKTKFSAALIVHAIRYVPLPTPSKIERYLKERMDRRKELYPEEP